MKKDFENILSYVKQNHKSFSEKPLNEVDSLVFCTLSYLYLESFFSEESSQVILLKDLAKSECLEDMFRYFDGLDEYYGALLGKDFDREASRDLLLYLAASPRYRDIRISHYLSILDAFETEQFGAVVFSLDEQEHYVAFRGTDWDIIGWKEDLLLALPTPVSAQKQAFSYLENVGNMLSGKLYVGGHSKGGNLAVYGASFCPSSVQEKIEFVFSHDGPGFPEEFLKEEGYLRVKERIRKTTPHSSYVAALLKPEAEPKIVECQGLALAQHYPLFWNVEEDHFLIVKEQGLISSAAVGKINDSLDALTQEEKEFFLETVFLVLDEWGIKNVGDFDKKFTVNVQLFLKAVSKLDSSRRAFVQQLIRQFVFGIEIDESLLNSSEEDSLFGFLDEEIAEDDL